MEVNQWYSLVFKNWAESLQNWIESGCEADRTFKKNLIMLAKALLEFNKWDTPNDWSDEINNKTENSEQESLEESTKHFGEVIKLIEALLLFPCIQAIGKLQQIPKLI